MEIERRWLVKGWPELTAVNTRAMEQGYVSTVPAVRARRESVHGGGERFILCFKSGSGLVRRELEFPLEAEEFAQLKDFIALPFIRKEQRRYDLVGGLTLEVNAVDPGTDTAFFYAEVEFPDESAAQTWAVPAELADYLTNEVTDQPAENMAAYWARTRLN